MLHFCPKSGIEWGSPWLTKSPRTTVPHPIFQLTHKQLLAVIDSLPESLESYTTKEGLVDQYLIGVAMLSHLPVHFRCAVNYKEASPKILMHWRTILRHFIKNHMLPADALPQYVIEHSTASLWNLKDYLESIDQAIAERAELSKRQTAIQQIMRKELVLQRLLNTQTSQGKAKLARILPEWAALVANFPQESSPLKDGTSKPLADIWKDIIQLSVAESYFDILVLYTIEDIIELRDELENTLELGTPYASFTLRALRNSIRVLQEFSVEKVTPPDLGTLLEGERVSLPSPQLTQGLTPARLRIQAILRKRKQGE